VGVRVAALYDLHANLAALEAVLADVEREQPDICPPRRRSDLGRAAARVVRAGGPGRRASALHSGNTDREARATGFPRTDFADELEQPWTRERVLALIEELS
jgi:hypothetical protein